MLLQAEGPIKVLFAKSCIKEQEHKHLGSMLLMLQILSLERQTVLSGRRATLALLLL